MTSPNLLLPLRVSELGPSLGKLVTGSGRTIWIPLDDIRVRLVTRVLGLAGDARRLASRDERAAALNAVGRENWQAAWEEALGAAATRVHDHVSTLLEAECRAVRMPRRLRRRVRLDDTERRAMLARLGSAGAGLVSALDVVEQTGGPAREATGLEREAVEAWQRSLGVAARRLEASWLALENAVDREHWVWRAIADQIAAWRKPVWPVILVGTIGLSVSVWFGVVLGGYMEAPAWFTRLWTALLSR